MNAPERGDGSTCLQCGTALVSTKPVGDVAAESACPACIARGLLSGCSMGPTIHTAEGEPEPLPIDIPGYEVVEAIGRGGMGAVYRARQQDPKREVALKLLHVYGSVESSEARQRFAREVDLAARLNHPNIVRVYESGLSRDSGIYYYTMELVNGRPLYEYLAENQRALLLDELLALFLKICSGVIHAHQHGVLHRDLTPANILIDQLGDPHLLDFGLAKALPDPREGSALPSLSIHGGVIGSLCSMSPEQARAEADVDTRSDVYSLGAILYHMLTEQWPHDQDGAVVDVLHRIAREPIRPPGSRRRDLSKALVTVLETALAPDREQRYQSVEAFAEDVDRYRRREELSVHPLGTIERWRLWQKRNPVIAALWSVSALLVLALAIGAPLVAFQQMRLRSEGIERELTRHRGFVRLLTRAGEDGLLESYRLMESELPAMVPLIESELAQATLPYRSRLRLQAALFPAREDLKGSLLAMLKKSREPAEVHLLAYVLRRDGEALAETFKGALKRGDLVPTSAERFNHYLALVQWAPDDGVFWLHEAAEVVNCILRANRRRSEQSAMRLFSPVKRYLREHVALLADGPNDAARHLLAYLVDDAIRDLVEESVRSDEAFRANVDRLEHHRVSTLAYLTGIYRDEVSRYRELPENGSERKRLVRIAAALILLERETDVWNQLGFSWALREPLIKQLPRLGVTPAMLHWKLRRLNKRGRLHEGMRTAITRSLLTFEPSEVPENLRANMILRQEAIINGAAPYSEIETLETAEQLLHEWAIK